MRRVREIRSAILALAIVITVGFGTGCGKWGGSGRGGAAGSSANAEIHRIEGQVALVGADDFSGAQVFVPGTSMMAMTDSEGNFSIAGVAAGSYRLMAMRQGYAMAELGPVEVAQAEQAETYFVDSISLEPAATANEAAVAQAPTEFGSLTGRVRPVFTGASGTPRGELDLSGCRIELAGTSMRTVTDADGTFYLWNVGTGEYTLVASLDGFEPFETIVEVTTEAEPPEIDVPLLAAASLARTIFGEIEGQLELYYADGSPSNEFDAVSIVVNEAPERAVRIRPNGRFLVTSLAGRLYTLSAFAPGYALEREGIADLRERRSANVTLILNAEGSDPDAPGAILGTAFKDSDEVRDMSGISIALAGTSMVAVTDVQGQFRIAGVAPGPYSLIAQAEGFEDELIEGIDLAPGEDYVVPDILLSQILDYPTVLESDPADGTRDVVISNALPISIRFSKKMDPQSVKSSLRIEPEVDFRVYASPDHPGADFDLVLVTINGASEEAPMLFDQAYRLTVGTGARDFEGLALEEPFTLGFTTSKPAVMGSVPGDGAEDIVFGLDRPVIVRFNTKLKGGVFDPDDLRIDPTPPQMPLLQLSDNRSTGWTELQIQALWHPDTKYEITISRRVKTATGQRLANTPYSFEFRTAKVRQFQPLDPTR